MEGPEPQPGAPAHPRRFRLHECLGRGGHGEVYRASMYRPGGVATEVALKVLASDVQSGSDPVHRLHDEGRLLAALSHPALLKVYDLVSLDGRVALVTEYVEGQDLHQAIYQGRVPVRALVEVVGQVAEALHSAWTAPNPGGGGQLRLVHRDIKPQNLRIGVHGEIKLLDFGIARALNDMQRESHTKNDIMMGSWPYLAPERMLERPAGLSSAVDVYGLGCVLFEGLAGQRLMEGQSLFALYRVVDVPGAFEQLVQARLQLLDASVPSELRSFLHKLLAENPADRPSAYQTGCLCEEIAERLSGPGLRRWARERAWPAHSMEPGPLTGRDLAEGVRATPSFGPPPTMPPPRVSTPPRPAPQAPLDRPPTWTPAVTKPRTPSLPPTLEGWMPPMDPTPAPAVGPAMGAPKRTGSPAPSQPAGPGGIIINDLGRQAAPERPRPVQPRARGATVLTLGLFAAGFGLFAVAGAGLWWILSQGDRVAEVVPNDGITPAAMATPEQIMPVPARPAPPAEPMRERIEVEPRDAALEPPPGQATSAEAVAAAPKPAPVPEPELAPVPEPAGAPHAAPTPEPAAASAPGSSEAEPLLDLVDTPYDDAPLGEVTVADNPAIPAIMGSRDVPVQGAALEVAPAPAAADADQMPGTLVVQGDALVELRGEFGAFRVGTPLLAGIYEVWADFGGGMRATSLRTELKPGGTVTVSCSIKAARCFVSPRLD